MWGGLMEDWKWAIIIIVVSIIIAILLSKRRNWRSNRKPDPVEHYTKARDKLSDVEEEDKSTAAFITFILIAIGLAVIFGIYKLVSWVFLDVLPKIPNYFNTINVTDNSTAMQSIGGTFGGIPWNVVQIIMFVTFFIIVITVIGGRRMRRNIVWILLLALPLMVWFGVSWNIIFIGGLFIIPIIVWRSMNSLRY